MLLRNKFFKLKIILELKNFIKEKDSIIISKIDNNNEKSSVKDIIITGNKKTTKK
jgi:CRISPR/Cas system-associated endoribonuclease Cas2